MLNDLTVMNPVLAFPTIGPWEVAVIIVIILLLFGGKKLPELARGLGKGLRLFKKELHDVKSDISDATDIENEKKDSQDKSENND